MKPCPYCDAELRDSVIRCTRCGRSLRGEPEPVAAPSSSGSATAEPPATSASPTDSVWAEPEPSRWRSAVPEGWEPPGPDAWKAPRPEAEWPPELDEPGEPELDEWTEPELGAWASPARTEQPSGSSRDPAGLRALPAERRWLGVRPDVVLLLSAILGIAASALAWQAVSEPWVRLEITDTSDRLDPVFIGEIVVRGRAAFVGTICRTLAGVIGALGVLWFVFGLDRGWTMRWFANPLSAIAAAVGGLAATVLSSTVWYVWEDAAVARARAVRISPEELQELLDLQPAPLVEIVRLPGLTRFGLMTCLGLVAASAAWWASRRRA